MRIYLVVGNCTPGSSVLMPSCSSFGCVEAAVKRGGKILETASNVVIVLSGISIPGSHPNEEEKELREETTSMAKSGSKSFLIRASFLNKIFLSYRTNLYKKLVI